MNPTTLLKLLFSGIPASDHIVSIDGVRKGPVTEAVARLEGPVIALRYAFQADGRQVVVAARVPLGSPGTPGGADEIEIDGQAVEGDDVVMSGTVTWNGPVVKIEFKWTEQGRFRRIRVDARAKWSNFG